MKGDAELQKIFKYCKNVEKSEKNPLSSCAQPIFWVDTKYHH